MQTNNQFSFLKLGLILGVLGFWLFIITIVLAQEPAPQNGKPTTEKAAPAKPEAALPEQVRLTAEETDKLRLIQLRLLTLANDLRSLREQAAKLEEQAKGEQNALNAALVKSLAKHGVKAEDLDKYEFRNAAPLDTEPIQLVKKPASPQATPPAKP